MRKKNIIGFLLALVILFSLGADSFAVYAEEVGQKPQVENKIPGTSEEVDKEKAGYPQKEEGLVQEKIEPEKKAGKLGEAEEVIKEKKKQQLLKRMKCLSFQRKKQWKRLENLKL
ncbi:hypothetical protein [Peptoniphilus grossensis]|uniref:hypothetical protein n=1 Tax=Peptoniphilus grossensis TaxID=1465756 RepID=UPI0039924520